jgi:hypothetical protein
MGHVMNESNGFAATGQEADLPLPTGMAAGTRIRTLDGVLPVEFLEPGDRIVTRSGARRLVSIAIRRCRATEIVRLSASTLAHNRPEADLLLGPGQPVIVRDWRARMLYGAEVAAVPSIRLADGEDVQRESRRQVLLYALRFAEDEVIWAEGIELACEAATVAAPLVTPAAGLLSERR